MADDTSPDPASPAHVLALTAQIVSAQVRGNKLNAAELPRLIRAVSGALDGLARPPTEADVPQPEPAVPVRRSVRPDAITCLVCGRRFKAIKRHLAADHGLTPDEYRARWGLPADYPMVAPDYADTRSRLAKQAGLGRKRAPEPEAELEVAAADPEPETEAVPAEESAPPPPTKRRGRGKATAAPGVQ